MKLRENSFFNEGYFLSSTFTVRSSSVNSKPSCIAFLLQFNNQLKYWKHPTDYSHFITDRNRLPPPDDSVAAEFFSKKIIYPQEESKQQIYKSTWFTLSRGEDDSDYKFYEYCIITPKYNTVLSVVWEEV